MKSSTKDRGIRIKHVREIGDVVDNFGCGSCLVIKSGGSDLPLSHLKTIADVRAHAKHYGVILEVERTDDQTRYVAPFGQYKSQEELSGIYPIMIIPPQYSRSRPLPQSEAEKVISLDYL